MFTGIIEEIGHIKKIELKNQGAFLTIKAEKILSDIKIGDSIAVNGACLTVVSFSNDAFSAELSRETLEKTALSKHQTNKWVNLERALKLGDRLGGHIVSGHVDCTGVLTESYQAGDNLVLEFEYPEAYAKYLINKGSITVDGISLTVAAINKNKFQIWVIPHTISQTTLEMITKGTLVNLEFDLVGKYIERLISHENSEKKISTEFLSQHGFV
jgi:riboflavin synthase